ncbi:MAG: protein kinase [Vicinamibacterales bacterium]
MQLSAGTVVGRYKVERRLGRGGMGTLYLAQDPVLTRPVALKLFHGDLDVADARERFAREARAAAALNHPNIVTIYDYGEFSTQPYIVMEFIEGRTLADLIPRGAEVPLGEKLRWLEELCTGASFVHRVGIIHRDIKPSNVMVDMARRIKVLDFGIARMDSGLSTTGTGPIGSPGYMAPEQIAGRGIDQRADIFAIGVLAYELITSTRAFQGETFEQVHKILNLHPPPANDLVAGLPGGLSDAIARAMAKDPAARFQDAESFSRAIAAVRKTLGSAPDVMKTVIIRRPGVPRGVASPGEPVVPPQSVAVSTPRPTTPWADSAELARRRGLQIEAALSDARRLMDGGNPENAREACERALTLDETHVDGLALYEVIKQALARQEAGRLLSDARRELEAGSLTQAANFLEQARTIDRDLPDAARLDRDLRLARVSAEHDRKRTESIRSCLQDAETALEQWDVEQALACAREVLDLDRTHARAQAIEAEALQRLDQETGAVPAASGEVPIDPLATVVIPAATMASARPAAHAAVPDIAPPPVPKPSVVVAATRSTSRRTPVAPAWALPGRTRTKAIAVVGVLIAAAVGFMALRPGPGPGPAVTGALVIDATPWAQVTAVTAADGTRISLPPQPSTPLSLTLPVGHYRVSLSGPPPVNERRDLELDVSEGQVVVAPFQQFSPLTAESYFEQYISSPLPAEGTP